MEKEFYIEKRKVEELSKILNQQKEELAKEVNQQKETVYKLNELYKQQEIRELCRECYYQ